ncbi:hypothetical protein AMECASPLE_002604 [Ameca splendens]|uniref:Uncharacterized protein n=1 Tax=Ameca splendens TaxID=208324 RepID=A0ABV0ZI33_9TELE
MLFVVQSHKANKKCNNGAEYSLLLVSFCILCTEETVLQRSDCCQDTKQKKERQQKQIQTTPTYISEKIVFKAAFSLNSQGVAKKSSIRKENLKEITFPDIVFFFFFSFSFF